MIAIVRASFAAFAFLAFAFLPSAARADLPHTDALLGELGFSADQIAQIKAGKIVDRDINSVQRSMRVAYSNQDNSGLANTRQLPSANFFNDGQVSSGRAAVLDLVLAPREVQVFTPA